jgi:hypothetical protein
LYPSSIRYTNVRNVVERLNTLPNTTYESISIDKKLVKDVRRYIQEFHGYRSPTEFIHEAVRLRILELDKIRIEKLRLKVESAKK